MYTPISPDCQQPPNPHFGHLSLRQTLTVILALDYFLGHNFQNQNGIAPYNCIKIKNNLSQWHLTSDFHKYRGISSCFQPLALIWSYLHEHVVLVIHLKVLGRKKSQTYVQVALILDLKVQGRKKKNKLMYSKLVIIPYEKVQGRKKLNRVFSLINIFYPI